MAKYFFIPKEIAKNTDLTSDQKLLISIGLQYHNAGVPEKFNSENVQKSIGMSATVFQNTVDGLISKQLVSYGKNGELVLNHAELILKKFLEASNYKDFKSIFIKDNGTVSIIGDVYPN